MDFTGILFSIMFAPSSPKQSNISVSTNPGAMQLAVIPLLAYSNDITLVIDSIAALDAQ